MKTKLNVQRWWDSRSTQQRAGLYELLENATDAHTIHMIGNKCYAELTPNELKVVVSAYAEMGGTEC